MGDSVTRTDRPLRDPWPRIETTEAELLDTVFGPCVTALVESIRDAALKPVEVIVRGNLFSLRRASGLPAKEFFRRLAWFALQRQAALRFPIVSRRGDRFLPGRRA